jgi:probable FeS assembly SUF system protein SufT
MTPRSAPIEIAHDCAATLIPSGDRIVLRRGDRVLVTQALGGNVTVQTDQGQLVRIPGADAVALGLGDLIEQPSATAVSLNGSRFHPDQVVEQLKTVFDPEIPVNVVDLGLIYACESELLPDGTYRVEIKMSMTAPGCGMGDVLRDDAHHRVAALPEVSEVDVELVWDPPWELSRMSDEARLELGML